MATQQAMAAKARIACSIAGLDAVGIDEHGRARSTIARIVEAGAAEQLVGASATLQDVVAVDTDQDVVAAVAEDLIRDARPLQLGIARIGAPDDSHDILSASADKERRLLGLREFTSFVSV